MTASSEKFCLKWNDFQQNIAASYQDLRNNPDFSDVTLVCEEDEQIEAHRLILTSCSPFFSKVLKRNTHSHPLIYMRGLKAKDLVAIVDFIYHGETNIHQDDLDDFLALASELQLKGLAGSEYNSLDDGEDPTKEQSLKQPQIQPILKQEYNFQPNTTKDSESFRTTRVENDLIVPIDVGKIHVAADTSTEDLRIKLDSMMESTNNGASSWRCTVCGKTTKDSKRNMRTHIETHIEGLSYPCGQCDNVSRSSNGLNLHVSRHHRK